VAAKAEAFRVCPKCGTRNKGKWEFCVRCGESLQNVTIASSAETKPGKSAKAAIKLGQAKAESSPVGAVAVAILLLAAAAWSVYYLRGAQPPPPMKTTAVLVAPKAAPAATPSTAPGGADELVTRARLKLAQNDVAGALPLLEQAVERDSRNASVHGLYAWALVLSGNLTKALAEYSIATDLDPQDLGFRAGKAGTLKLAGRFDEAIAEYQRIAAQGGAPPDVEEDYGSVLLNAKQDAAGALTHFRKASEAAPDNVGYREQLAYALEQSHDTEGARKEYEKILEKNPAAAVSRGRLAEILLGQGRNDDAIALTRTGIQIDASVPILHRDLGSLLERSGHPLEASAAYREYARLAPNAPDANEMKERANALAQGGGGSSP
jgi:tetratricopeptide (TPR) repeat protein